MIADPYSGEQLTRQDRHWLAAASMYGVDRDSARRAAQLAITVWERLRITEDLLQTALNVAGKATL